MKAAIIGGGVIGGGWAARFLLNGWDVAVFDPDPDANRKIDEVLTNARRSLPGLYDRTLPDEGALTFHQDVAETVVAADWIQESVPERLDLKHKVFAQIIHAAKPDAVVGSSTSGFKPSDLNTDDDRIIVAHPFNPVYLLPLVELVGNADLCNRAADILRDIGMFPLHVRTEIDAHIADRLLEAVWREALWLIRDGICTTAELDDAIRMGFGLRWAQMGLFETYRIAGGEAGMKHFMAQFGPALKWPWTKLTDVPDLTDDLVDLIASQSDDQSGHLAIRDLERLRDDNLVGIMRALKHSGSGAGGVIAAHERRLAPAPSIAVPLIHARQVPTSWTDYNGHMNETHYLEVASKANDLFMEMIGADAAYIAAGKSYFTVENTISYLAEVHAGDQIRVETLLTDKEGKRLGLLHNLYRGDGELAATIASLMLHVDLNSRKTCPPEARIADRLADLTVTRVDVD